MFFKLLKVPPFWAKIMTMLKNEDGGQNVRAKSDVNNGLYINISRI